MVLVVLVLVWMLMWRMLVRIGSNYRRPTRALGHRSRWVHRPYFRGMRYMPSVMHSLRRRRVRANRTLVGISKLLLILLLHS
jgi:hypothetical protein